MYHLQSGGRDQRFMAALRQPAMQILRGAAYQNDRNAESTNERRKSCKAACGVAGFNCLGPQRAGDSGALQGRAVDAAGAGERLKNDHNHTPDKDQNMPPLQNKVYSGTAIATRLRADMCARNWPDPDRQKSHKSSIKRAQGNEGIARCHAYQATANKAGTDGIQWLGES